MDEVISKLNQLFGELVKIESGSKEYELKSEQFSSIIKQVKMDKIEFKPTYINIIRLKPKILNSEQLDLYEQIKEIALQKNSAVKNHEYENSAKLRDQEKSNLIKLCNLLRKNGLYFIKDRNYTSVIYFYLSGNEADWLVLNNL